VNSLISTIGSQSKEIKEKYVAQQEKTNDDSTDAKIILLIWAVATGLIGLLVFLI
jgi:hypothetical protein